MSNINRDNLVCIYRAYTKAWMIYFFFEWIKWFDRKMSDQSVLMLIDNSSVHIPVDDLPLLSNTEFHYLPPNPNSKLQLCDAGIIRKLKAYYRRRFNQNLSDAVKLV